MIKDIIFIVSTALILCLITILEWADHRGVGVANM